MIEKEKFERHLRGTSLSENTISSYMFAIKQYGEQYDDVTQKKLREYKVWLIENYKPKTVNLRLRAICIWHIQTAEFAEQNGRNAKLNGRIIFDY